MKKKEGEKVEDYRRIYSFQKHFCTYKYQRGISVAILHMTYYRILSE